MKFSKRIIAMILTLCFVFTGGFTVFAENSKLDNYLISNGFKLLENRGKSASSAQVYMNAKGDMISRSASVMQFELGVYPIRQQKSNWCWAASTEMVDSYYNMDSKKTQNDVVKYIFGSEVDQKGTVGQTTKALGYISDYTIGVGYYQFKTTKTSVYNWINNYGPFIMYLHDPEDYKKSCHMVVCVGYQCSDFDDPSSITDFCIIDPAQPIAKKQYIPYESLDDTFKFNDNGPVYVWSANIVTRSTR